MMSYLSLTELANGSHPTTVSVIDSESPHEKNKKMMIYKVAIDTGLRQWFIFRRYNEFHSLYDKVKKLYSDADLKFPGKKLLGNLDPNFLRNRRDGLNDFVQKLIAHPGLSTIPEVRLFLNLDNPRQHSTEDEEDEGYRGTITAGSVKENGNGHAIEDLIDLGPSERPHARPSDFEFLKVIGKGSFGKVLVAKHKTEGKMYAVKVLNKSHIMRKNEAKHIMSERNVLVKNVQHPFLVGLYYSFQTLDRLYFVLDYVQGGELFFHLQRERCFSEARSRFYSAEMASALGYLHSLNIIYRDLKPENILLDSQGHVVLTDFGLCKEGIEGRGTTSTFCGTPEYLAPEVLKKQPYDKTVDWWCLGAVLYEMMFGLPPFYSRDTNEMYDNILTKPLKFRGNIASSSARHILEGLLQKQKERRLAATNDFQDIKSHAFYSSINWTQLDQRKIRPPYNPNVSGQLDFKHFDPEFVREPVPASVGRSVGMVSASVQDADHVFDGFSYVPPEGDAFDS